MKKKLTLLFALLCASVMGWAVQYCGNAVQSTIENTGISVNVTIEKIGATTTRIILDNEHIVSLRAGGCFQQWPGGVWKNNDNAPGVSNFEQGWSHDGTKWQKDFEWDTYPTTANIYFLMNLDASTSEPHGAGFTLTDIDMSASCSGGGSTPEPDPDPAVTGVCSTETYNSNVAGYDIHAKVTKGCNKYYLTISSATEGKTITGLVGDNMFCNRYCDEARTHNNNYHMAAAGHYTLTDGKVIFTIPSIGDPKMYTPLSLMFSDNQAVEVSALNGLRLEPCSSEAAAECPDPEPTEIQDVNFALINNGAIAYASNGNAWDAIDGNDGSRWESAFSDPQWFIVDLGQRRIFNTVQIRWQTAYSRTFTIDVSNDGETWTTKKVESNYTGGGENVEYEVSFGENVTARYVRLSSTARATEWGNSFYEFRVVKATTPVLTTYTASIPSPFCTIGSDYQVTVAAKDQLGNDFPVSTTYSVSPVASGNITAAGVYTPLVAGEATITAEGGGMSSSITVHNEVSVNLAFEKTAHAGQDDANAYKANNSDLGDRWGSEGGTHPDNDWWYVDLGATYDIAEVAIKWERARPKYYVLEVSSDASSWNEIGSYDALPADDGSYQIYSGLTAIPGQYLRVRATSTEGGYDNLNYGISIYDFRVYGTENVSSNKHVSATASPAAGGTVTVQASGVDVTEVENGTEVTFTATPNEGYDFVNWTKGGVAVSTNATYVVSVTESMALEANFETHRTAYCAVPLNTTADKTLYLTITNPSANTYKILLEGSADNKIESAYNNFSFVLSHINGETGNTALPAASWTTDNSGYGSAYVTFTAENFREVTFVNKYVVFDKQGGGLTEFNAFPDANLIKWDATCTDDEAPVLAAPTASPLSGTSVRLALSATDNMAALLTYTITYAGLATPIEVPGAAGEVTYYNVTGLSAGTNYTFSVTASDGTNVSAAQTCSATPSMPTAPVPTHPKNQVRSIYSDAYPSALEHDYNKNSWSWIPYTTLNVSGDQILLYNTESAKWFSFGMNNDGNEAIIAKEMYNDGVNKGLDVRQLKYLHVDIWTEGSSVGPVININNDNLAAFNIEGSGWHSYDFPLNALPAERLNNVRWMGFAGFNGLNSVAIDNVYFWSDGVPLTPEEGWATYAPAEKVSVPTGITAYWASYNKEGSDEQLVLHAITENVIPAGTGVILKGTPGGFGNFTATDAAAPSFSENILVGCPVQTDISAIAATNDIFCLRYSELYSMTGFFLYGGTVIGAGKAYLPLPKESGASGAPRRMRFVIKNEQTATGIDNTVSQDGQAEKFIENGQLFIRRGDVVYTIQGVRVK